MQVIGLIIHLRMVEAAVEFLNLEGEVVFLHRAEVAEAGSPMMAGAAVEEVSPNWVEAAVGFPLTAVAVEEFLMLKAEVAEF